MVNKATVFFNNISSRSLESIKKLIVIIIEVLLIVFLSKYLPNIKIVSYLTWIKYAILVAALAIIMVILINVIVYKEEFREIKKILKKIKWKHIW